MLNNLISVGFTSRETIYCIGRSGIVIYAPSRPRHSLMAPVAGGGPGKEESCWHSGGENMHMLCPCGCSLSWVSNCRSDTDRWLPSFWSLVCKRLKKYEDLNQIAWKCSNALLNFLLVFFVCFVFSPSCSLSGISVTKHWISLFASLSSPSALSPFSSSISGDI